MGGMGVKDTRETMKRISDIPTDKQLTLVATGKYKEMMAETIK